MTRAVQYPVLIFGIYYNMVTECGSEHNDIEHEY